MQPVMCHVRVLNGQQSDMKQVIFNPTVYLMPFSTPQYVVPVVWQQQVRYFNYLNK